MPFTNAGPSITTALNTQAAATNVQQFAMLSVSLTPVAVAANTAAEQTFAVTGLAVTDAVFVNKPSAQAGLGIANVRVSAANTLAITYVNATASSITPTAEAYALIVARPNSAALNAGLPSVMPLI